MVSEDQRQCNSVNTELQYLFPSIHHVVPDNIVQRYLMNAGNKIEMYNRMIKFIMSKSSVKPVWDPTIIQREIFVPAGNTLVAGKRQLQPNCSILGTVTDSNLTQMISRATLIWKSAIGIGFDLTGCQDPVAVLKTLSELNHSIELEWSRPKRGNMATLSIHHPRVLEFIHCKSCSEEASQQLYNFNISVSVTDKFMEYALANPDNDESNLLFQIAHHAWKCGDPGLVFIDRVQDEHHEEGPIVTCVPCGEQFMHNNETCNLGSINLTNLLYQEDGQIYFDWNLYESAIKTAVLFMDQVIDLYQIPDQIMAKTAVRLRRIGLGVMGFARMLQLMNIPYQSEKALWWADHLAYKLTEEANRTSWSITSPNNSHRRNITVTCVAPTGGIRNLVDTDSYGIEPLFTQCSSIDPLFSVKMTAAWQKHLENSISKTINLANDVDVKVVLDVILEAYHSKLKGITVYRDGSRLFQPKKIKCDGDSCQLS